MNDNFSLIDFSEVMQEVKLGRSAIWKNVQDEKFPRPIGGRRRACWSKIQISDYLYQLSRYGFWTQERSNEVLDQVHASTIKSRNTGVEGIANDER